jgi:Protein of unknown function (DUF2679).
MADFPPPRHGLSLQITLILLLTVFSVLFGLLASREAIGLRFMLYILAAAVTFIPLPFLVYWLYSLNRANYSLDRDKMTLTWGLRTEQIPVSDVEWVRPLSAMAVQLPMPFFRLPGAILGVRNHPDLGSVEFLASDVKSLLLIATAKRVYVISPQDPNGFMQTIQHSIEMGSLSPVIPHSVYVSFTVVQAWESRLARYLWFAGLFLNVGLLAWVSLMVPSLGRIPLGFLPSGAPGDAVLGAGLILLPVLSIFFYLVGWVAGLAFYRRPGHRPLAFIIWASGVLTAVLFLIAVMFIVTASV